MNSDPKWAWEEKEKYILSSLRGLTKIFNLSSKVRNSICRIEIQRQTTNEIFCWMKKNARWLMRFSDDWSAAFFKKTQLFVNIFVRMRGRGEYFKIFSLISFSVIKKILKLCYEITVSKMYITIFYVFWSFFTLKTSLPHLCAPLNAALRYFM